jgi:hypothetical protein
MILQSQVKLVSALGLNFQTRKTSSAPRYSVLYFESIRWRPIGDVGNVGKGHRRFCGVRKGLGLLK